MSTNLTTDNTALSDVLARHRFHELDGVRGIAAMMVAIGHCVITVFAIPALTTTGLAAAAVVGIINGGIAVDLFFIMSGFFLAGMIESMRGQGILAYYARRLARLAPPAIVSVVLLYIYTLLFMGPGIEGGTLAAPRYVQFHSDTYHMRLPALLLNLGLIRHTVNPVLWTISLEIFISLLYPAVMWLHWWRTGTLYRAGLLAVILIAAVALNAHQKLGIDVTHYLYMFYAGTLVRDMAPAIRRLPGFAPGLIAGAGVVLMAVTGELVPLHNTHPLRFDMPVTLGGVMLIAMLAHAGMPRARALMCSAPIQFLGRISYSVYLANWLAIHTLGQIMLARNLPGSIGLAATVTLLTLTTVLLLLPLGWVLHALVERPAVAWSRRLGQAWAA